MATPPKKTNRKKTTPMNAPTAFDNATPVAAPVKRSLEQRLADTLALAEKYRAEINSLRQINNVQVGDTVTFKFGRAEKARNIAGTVIATGDTPQGKVAAISTGEGLDIKTVKVRAADIVSNPSADARNSEGDAPADASVETSEDPLNAA